MSASDLITARIRELGDWRGETLALVRKLIREADPAIVEEWKWGVPVWSRDGIVCTGETYKQAVKLTFARGALIRDPRHLFNSSMTGNTRRAIDFHAGDEIDGRSLQDLVREAVAFNRKKAGPGKVKLLSGGNPQIAKGDGDAPVQAFIAAMPGWKRDVGRKLDALISRAVPKVRKAVKWNSPFYGMEGKGWFLSFHCFSKYIKVGFFRGASLRPRPPGVSKQKDVRYLDIREDEPLDEKRMTLWVKQASKLPGWMQ
jgi:hypothetical protein